MAAYRSYFIHGYYSFRKLKFLISMTLSFIILLAFMLIISRKPEDYIDDETLGDEPSNGSMKDIYIPGFQIANERLCPNSGKDLLIMIIVISAPKDWEERLAIRNTWGNANFKRYNVSIGFLIGMDNKYDLSIEEENKEYNDIILTRSRDTFNNLTLKSVSMLEWGSTYCHKVKFFLKADDDLFLNTPLLINFARSHINLKKTIMGKLAFNYPVVKDKNSKYYVNIADNFYPNFTTGPAYMFTADVVTGMYLAALNRTYFKLEDVFLTGYLAEDLGIFRKPVPAFFNSRPLFESCFIQRYISFHKLKVSEQYRLWRNLYANSKCYNYVRLKS